MAEADGHLDAGDVRQLERQQALLQRARDVGALAVEPVVVDRRRAAPGQLVRHLDVVLVEASSRGAGGERQRPERPLAGRHRHDHRRTHADRSQQQIVLLGAGGGPQQIVGHLLEQPRLTAPHHLVGAPGRARLGREAAAQLDRLLAQGRVRVGERDALEPAVRRDQVDGAPVRHLGDREPRHPREQLVRVEPAAEDAAAPRQECLRALGALVLRDVLDHVDRHRHTVAAVPDRVRLHGRPALLAGVPHAEAHDRLGRLLAREGAPSGQIRQRVGPAGLVEDLVAGHDLGGRSRLQRLPRLEAQGPHRSLVRVQEAAVGRLRRDRVGHAVQHGLELVARRAAVALAVDRRPGGRATTGQGHRNRSAGRHRQQRGEVLVLGGGSERGRQGERQQGDDRRDQRSRTRRCDQRARREQHQHGAWAVERDRDERDRQQRRQRDGDRHPVEDRSPPL